jgi:hypothetical protein
MTNDGMKYGVHAGRVASGLIILALGALMLLNRHSMWGFDAMRLFPGVVLILIGGVWLLWGDCRRDRASFSGFWLVLIGVWLIANQTHAFGIDFRHSWPLLLVGWGVVIVARELFGRREDPRPADTASPEPR